MISVKEDSHTFVATMHTKKEQCFDIDSLLLGINIQYMNTQMKIVMLKRW